MKSQQIVWITGWTSVVTCHARTIRKTVREYGFTDERVVQDFPIRGKAVYLHVRRRKWRDTEDGSIFSYDYDLTEEGSRLTPEFVAFLKEED